jgi:hypothetical protein
MTDLFQHLGACPLCSKKLTRDRVRVIRETARAVFAEAECATCAGSLLFAVIRSAFHQAGALESLEGAAGFTTMIGMISDLTLSDAKALAQAKPLRADDVLMLHRYLLKKEAPTIHEIKTEKR